MRLCTLSLMATLALAFTSSPANEPTGLEQEADRINYSLGHQIGTDFKNQQVELDRVAIERGMQDALEGVEPLLPQDDMERRLLKLKGQITEDMQSDQLRRVKERKENEERKLGEARAFLEENAKKPGVITRSNGLQYRVIREGSGASPKSVDNVTIHYRAKRIDGREYDSNDNANTQRSIRVADMIPGLKQAVLMMQPGAKWELYIPPDLAYGRKHPLAYEAVIIEVELLSVESAGNTDTTGDTAGSPDVQQP